MKRRKINLTSFEEITAEVDQLLRNGYDRAGNWSLGQVCNHLAAAIEMTTNAKLQFVPRFAQRFFIAAFLTLVPLGKYGTAMGLRMSTSLPQKQSIDNELGIDRLRKSIANLQEPQYTHLHSFHLFHCNHHLSFLIPRNTAKSDGCSNGEAS